MTEINLEPSDYTEQLINANSDPKMPGPANPDYLNVLGSEDLPLSADPTANKNEELLSKVKK